MVKYGKDLHGLQMLIKKHFTAAVVLVAKSINDIYFTAFFLCLQGPAVRETLVANAVCSRSFTRAKGTPAVPRPILETAAHGVPQLQVMTPTNCGDTAQDEEVRNTLS